MNEQALAKIEARLKKRDIAAFIMEPISINLGVLIPDARFMQGLRRLCKKYGTLLIADEVEPALAVPENSSRANTSICSRTSCAWRKQSPVALAEWAQP